VFKKNISFFCNLFRSKQEKWEYNDELFTEFHFLSILPVVLYGCETSLLILSDEYLLMVFESSVPLWTFGPKRESGEDYITRSLMLCTLYQIVFK
jgi:hypothetical protein